MQSAIRVRARRIGHLIVAREAAWSVAACAAVFGISGLSGCAAPEGQPARVSAAAPVASRADPVEEYHWLNKLTWGANSTVFEKVGAEGAQAYLDRQLRARVSRLPDPLQSQVDSMTITQRPLEQLVQEMEQRRKAADSISNDDEKKAAQQAYQQEMNRLAREAATRHVLRALHSPNQVHEQMAWFWLNHFSVHQNKSNLRAIVGDYEEAALRPHALGKFRDLLGAVVLHPAMLRYLDNEQNAAGRINENFARELMELHTLGVDGGYAQRDVQELARVLTGVGINLAPGIPNLRKDLQSYYVRRGLFEFNPARHDFGEKQLMGLPIRGRGLAELDEALDRLARNSATARFISRKLAIYWLADDPSAPLVERMAQTFLRTDGNIADTLRALFRSPDFNDVRNRKFKDPMRYVVSSVRLAYDDKPILNVGPILNWLNRMGEPLYGRATPDGYSLQESAWASSGQMTTRFEIAKAIGSGNAGLFKTEGPQPQDRPAFPQLANALYYQAIGKTLSPATKDALDRAGSPQEWNTFLLSSPELMYR